MKKSIIISLAIILVSSVVADNYKILRMSKQSQTIKIGNRLCKVGDVFSDRSIIYWSKDKQAFRAQNMKTKEVRLFVEPDFRNKSCKSIKDYFLKRNHLSTRVTHNLKELSEVLSQSTYYLFDTICIKSPIPLDSTCLYYIEYKMNGKDFRNELRNAGNHFVINRSLLQIDENINELTLSVYFKREGIDKDYHLTDSMKISVIP